MQIKFDASAPANKEVENNVKAFLESVSTGEAEKSCPVILFQDGVKKSYYIRCTVAGETVAKKVSLDARLNPDGSDTFRDNRELMLRNNTFIRMESDAENKREFNDIIAEYITSYSPDKPLKVWGGQHRSKAIMDAYKNKKVSRYHGFRVYFNLSKEQRAELALVSNTSIAASNDLFDRQLEEAFMGPHLRRWCLKMGLLKKGEDFLDAGSRAEGITVQAARSFIVNYFKGKQAGEQLKPEQLDMNVYEPYLCQTGIVLDEEYRKLTEEKGSALWTDKGLAEAGKAFAKLHATQYTAIKKSPLDRRNYRMKAFTLSVLSAWAYVAGLLQAHPARLAIHLTVPEAPKGIPDPLNADEMANFKYYQDPENLRGLGTRAALKDRQRMAQVFLARTTNAELTLDKKLLNQAVNQVAALRFFSRGYTA
ncbi:MAG: hypothetical protein PHR56_01590 [Dehalococcoidales bacterium]|nr:hypothetical protein [Dehalococcoidales bacterium]